MAWGYCPKILGIHHEPSGDRLALVSVGVIGNYYFYVSVVSNGDRPQTPPEPTRAVVGRNTNTQ